MPTIYNDLINVPSFWKKKENFRQERWEILFYCRDCKKIVEVKRVDPKKYLYKCKECKGKDISIGTEESIKEFYTN